jgi:hypothetical protein
MLEALLAFALSTGTARAFRVRLTWAVLGGLLALYLVVADALNVVAAPEPLSPFFLFSFMFLGPSMSPYRAAGVLPVPSLCVEQPVVLRLARLGLCATLAWLYLQRSSKLNPLLPRAYALDAAALPFAGAAVLDTLELTIQIAAWYYASRI